MTHTAKPCPGCGETPGYRFRDSEKVCEDCQKKLADAATIIAGMKKRKDLELRRGPWADYALPGIYRKELAPQNRASDDKNGNKPFRDAMNELIKLIGTPAGEAQIFESVDNVVTGTQRGSSGTKYYFPKGFGALLDRLFEATQLIADSAYTDGRQDGANIIVGLASGDVNIETFNRATIGDSVPRRRARRR